MNRATPKFMLRIALLLGWTSSIAYLLLSDSFNSQYPTEIQQHLLNSIQEETSFGTLVVFTVGVPLFLASIVASLGLFFYKRWALKLYVVSSLVLTLLTIGLGPRINHGFFTALNDISYLTVGFIIAIICFTDALDPSETGT